MQLPKMTLLLLWETKSTGVVGGEGGGWEFLWSKVRTMVKTVLHKIYPCHLPALISPITSSGTW